MDGTALVTRGAGDQISYVTFLCPLLFLITHFKYIPNNNAVHSQNNNNNNNNK